MGNKPSKVFILKKYSIISKQVSLEFSILFETDLLPRVADVILAALHTIKALNSATSLLLSGF